METNLEVAHMIELVDKDIETQTAYAAIQYHIAYVL